MIAIQVHTVNIPPVTIGFGVGDDIFTGQRIVFVGDAGRMRCLRDVLVATGEPAQVEIEDWQVISVISKGCD